MNREDFNILNSGIIYFDNGATTLKPKILSEAVSDYYNNYSSNAHRLWNKYKSEYNVWRIKKIS